MQSELTRLPAQNKKAGRRQIVKKAQKAPLRGFDVLFFSRRNARVSGDGRWSDRFPVRVCARERAERNFHKTPADEVGKQTFPRSRQ